MKIIIKLATSIALAALTITCFAQEEEETPERYTYATYFNCGGGGSLAAADAAIAEDYERMDAFVDDGTVASWGYMSHHTGGQWQRIIYTQADSLAALLDAGDTIGDDGDDADDADDADDDTDAFGAACNIHDDYIWQVKNGMGGEDRGTAGLSVYHVCDINKEERADEIVAEHVAPILNKMVEDGALTSWGWQSHVIGGEYRRLQTMTASDHKSLISARNDAIAAIYADESEAGEEFSAICGPHVDYMWNIVHAK